MNDIEGRAIPPMGTPRTPPEPEPRRVLLISVIFRYVMAVSWTVITVGLVTTEPHAPLWQHLGRGLLATLTWTYAIQRSRLWAAQRSA